MAALATLVALPTAAQAEEYSGSNDVDWVSEEADVPAE